MPTIVHNSPLSPPGRLADLLSRAGVAADHVHPHRGEPLPQRPRAVIVLGGEMGSYDDDRLPFLADQKAWISRLVQHRVPILGICLGAQLIVDALGGTVMEADRPEADLIDLVLTDAGRSDPVLGAVRSPVLTLHQDTFELPGEAALLARSDHHPQAFRIGSALGVQFHPEVESATLTAWARRDLRPLIDRAGTDPEALIRRFSASERHLATEAAGLIGRWLASF